jgi:hypothetical protein
VVSANKSDAVGPFISLGACQMAGMLGGADRRLLRAKRR